LTACAGARTGRAGAQSAGGDCPSSGAQFQRRASIALAPGARPGCVHRAPDVLPLTISPSTGMSSRGSPTRSVSSRRSPSPCRATSSPLPSAEKTVHKGRASSSISAGVFGSKHAQLRADSAPAAVFYPTSHRLGKAPPALTVNIPEKGCKTVSAVAVVLGGDHARPVPLYSADDVLEVVREAGGDIKAVEHRKFFGNWARQWKSSAGDKVPVTQLPERLSTAGRGRPKQGWVLTYFGVLLLLDKLKVPPAVVASAAVQPGHVAWEGADGRTREGSSQPGFLANFWSNYAPFFFRLGAKF